MHFVGIFADFIDLYLCHLLVQEVVGKVVGDIFLLFFSFYQLFFVSLQQKYNAPVREDGPNW